MPDAEVSAEPTKPLLADVLGRIPSGLFILTACSGDGRETGLLASWVQQASFEPPMVTVAVNVKRYLHDWFAASPYVGLNIIGEGQKHFLKHFGAGFDANAAAFDGIPILRGTTGVPLLADALGYLEGRVVSQLPTGDHVIYAVEVTSAGRGTVFDVVSPWVHIRKNGLKY